MGLHVHPFRVVLLVPSSTHSSSSDDCFDGDARSLEQPRHGVRPDGSVRDRAFPEYFEGHARHLVHFVGHRGGHGLRNLKFSTAIAGCGMICLIMFYIRVTSFGTRHRYDTILNLHWQRPTPEIGELDDA